MLQISGKKQWTVANKPLVYLTTPDLKYKPSPSYLNEYMSPGNYSTFMLQPGDVLYIPRGFVHNASTTKTLVGGEPSLHLTFGIEHGKVNCLINRTSLRLFLTCFRFSRERM